MLTPEFLDITAAICPERTAVIFEGRRLSYEQVQQRVKRLASAFSALGVNKGDTVSLIQVNTPHCIEAYFAAALLGAVYVPLNFRAKPSELEYMVNTADAKVLLAGDRYVPVVDELRGRLPSVEHYVQLDGRSGSDSGWRDYEALVAGSDPDPPFVDVPEEAVTLLMYTAGTTGFPKGVMLPHTSFTSYVLNNVSPVDPDLEERNLLTVPLYHIAGVQAVMAAMFAGRTLVMQRQFEAREWMGLAQEERVQRAMMVPTMLKQIIDHPDFQKYDLSSLKVITYGAAPMPVEVISRALQAFPACQFINAFGQTETAATITALNPEDHHVPADLPEQERQRRLRRLASVGRALPDVEVRVVDEYGNEVARGVAGEVVARGDRVMAGYWKDEERTKQTKRGGWIYTGDLGYMDEEGYLFLSGRASDVIIRGGENISPEEVEGVLTGHPAVEECAVFGVPHDTWGETVAAAVVIKAGHRAEAEELQEWCRERLASFKKPEAIAFRDELPRNPLGKLLRRELREAYGSKNPAPP